MPLALPQVDLRAALGDKPTDRQRLALFQAAGYEPHDEQMAFHFATDSAGEPLRRKMVLGGEQAGKSISAAMEMFSQSPWGELFWIVGPDYNQTHNEFNYLEEALRRVGMVHHSSRPEKGPWRLETIFGSVVESKSARDVATIAGKAPDGILLVEAAQCSYEAFLRCMGRTGPKRGWLCVNGTLEKDTGLWMRRLWKSWQTVNPFGGKSFSLPSWTNHHLYPGGREDPELVELERAFGSEHFLERFGGVPVPPKGLVFREFDYQTHVRLIERVVGTPANYFPEPARVLLPEETEDVIWVDPGFRHAYAVLFVTLIGEYAFVYDEIYKRGNISEEVITQCQRHPRWRYVKSIVMDISGRGHPNGQKAPAESWKERTGMLPRAQRVEVLDGIERTRISLAPMPETGEPQLIFSPDCTNTVWELSDGYRYPETPMGEPLPTEKPKDENNDAAKAIAYGLVQAFGRVKRKRRGGRLVPPADRRRKAGYELFGY